MQTQPYLRYFLTLLMLACSSGILSAQTVEKDMPKDKKEKKHSKFDPNPAVIVAVNYTAQFPFGNMADRYGFNSLFSAQVMYKTRTNWLVGAEGGFLFGTKVRENYVLDNISSSTAQFITTNSNLTTIHLQEQGFNIKFNFGKVIPIVAQYPDAGIMLLTGFGFLEHRIGVNVRATLLPQLNKTYRKGYDRMSNGPVISQFVGGVFMSKRKFWSGYAGVQFDAAFTQGRRAYDFYSMAPLHDKRFDLFLGIRVGWMIPIFQHTADKEYMYY